MKTFHSPFASVSSLRFCGVRGAAVLIIVTLFLFILNLFVGSVEIPASEVINILLGKGATRESWRFIVLESRLPQAITAVLCGSALAVCGLLLQTAFRNPLAGPGIFGITSGASLAVAVVMLALGGSIGVDILHFSGFIAILAAAFAGAMVVTAILYAFSRIVRHHVMLLIVGIMVGYLSSSAVTLLNFFSTEEGVRSYVMWGMGSFGAVSMGHVPLFAVGVLVGITAAVVLVKPLNAMLLGDNYAESLGINTRRLRTRLLLVTGLLCAVTTAFCGPVAFIGLAVPHMARLVLHRENHRQLMPATLLLGAVVALACNLICQLPTSGTTIPLNAVTPFFGAPVIIYMILKRK